MSPSVAEAPNLPKHRAIAAALIDEIRAGRFRPGDRLPSEPELSKRFGVSRHTVRIALRSLHEQGLVTSQQGLGTIVRRASVDPRYSYTLGSITDLLQYAAVTPRAIFEAQRVRTDEGLAAWLEAEAGELWWVIHTRRSGSPGGSAIASSKIFVPDQFGPAVAKLRASNLPMFALLEQEFGVQIAKVRQVLLVATATEQEADDLGITAGEAVMCIERRFLDVGGRLVEVSRSVHPGETFRYAMTLQLTRPAGP